MTTIAFLDTAACFTGEIRRLRPQEMWEQFVQQKRADRIRRERDTRVVELRRERDRALRYVRS